MKKTLELFLQKAIANQDFISGFPGYITLENVAYYKKLQFKCVSVTNNAATYLLKTSNPDQLHTILITYNNLGDRLFPNYKNFRVLYYQST